MKQLLTLFNTLILSFFVFAQVQSGPFAGAVTDTSAVFIVKTYSPQKVRIEIFEDKSSAPSIYSKEYITEDTNYNYVKVPVGMLKPNTQYYYRAIVNNFPSKRWHGFKTFPADKRVSFSFGFGSCQQSGYAKWNPEIFPVIAQDSLRFFIQIGDWTYPDSTEKKYGYRFNSKMDLIEKSFQSKYNYNYPFPSEVLSQMPVAYVYDDHDFAANNPDGTDSNKDNSIKAYEKFFPYYPLKNPANGLWQSFTFGDVEFFILDLRSQRSRNKEIFNEKGELAPPPGHSILAGFNIDGENQRDWLLNALKRSKAKWKVIVSSVIFNPAYAKVLDNKELLKKYEWMKDDMSDKWAGFPEDIKQVLNTIKDNDIKGVLVLSGDTHSSYIDNGSNSVIPEISASNLDVPNSHVTPKLAEFGLKIWSEGSYEGEGHTYGKVSFIYGNEDYALLEIIDEKGNTVVSYKLKQ